jgi:hypothetical protein
VKDEENRHFVLFLNRQTEPKGYVGSIGSGNRKKKTPAGDKLEWKAMRRVRAEWRRIGI